MNNKWIYFLFLFIFLSCSESDVYLEEAGLVNKDLDCMLESADSAIIKLQQKRDNHESLLDRIERQKRSNSRLHSYYSDSINTLTELNLINRDSVMYEYEIEIIEVVDTVEVHIADSVCPVCVKRSNRFRIFKKKK